MMEREGLAEQVLLPDEQRQPDLTQWQNTKRPISTPHRVDYDC